MFMDIQSGYLLIGIKDSQQSLSNPRTIGDFQNIFIMLYLVKNYICILRLRQIEKNRSSKIDSVSLENNNCEFFF